jgi:hypothetical protein
MKALLGSSRPSALRHPSKNPEFVGSSKTARYKAAEIPACGRQAEE